MDLLPHPDSLDDELSLDHQISIATWFLLHSPPGEIQYVAKDLQGVLGNDAVFQAAAKDAFPRHNKDQMLAIELSDGSGHVLISEYGAIDADHFIDFRTAQIATIDHIKQVCTGVRPAADDELPSPFIEEYRAAVDAEVLRYVEEAFPRGHCATYAPTGKNSSNDGPFDLIVIISSAKLTPKNYCNGRWRSVWKIEFDGKAHTVELKGNIKVSAHYFEEGNVQLDTSYECKDSTVFQSPIEAAQSIAGIIQHHESQYLACLDDSYSKLSDNTFKELRRKLPVTRTLFPWATAHQLSITRELTRAMASK